MRRAFYGGPYLVVNMWLIIYTWLQHTDVDVPHLGSDDFSYMRGAFLTIDRPCAPLTTHASHPFLSSIPHHRGAPRLSQTRG